MTTHAVASSSTISGSSKSATNTTTQNSTAAFERQLHAARQRDGQATPGHESTPQARPQRGPDPGRDRQNDPSPMGPHSRHPNTGADRLGTGRHGASSQSDTASTAVEKNSVTAKVSAAPATTTAASPGAEVLAGVAPDESTTLEQDADGNEQGAAALVGAMLALIGPATNKILAPGAAGLPASSGKPVAADAGPAVLLQVGDAAAMAVTTTMAATAMPAQLLTANGLSLDPNSLRDSARTDAAPALLLSVPAPAAPVAPVSVPISAPASSHAFAQELGQQVTWFVGQDVKHARIRLHPEELGSLDLKISVNHGRVDVVFHAQHPGAVTAVQQSLPQLDQMLAQHGLSLGNAEVGQQHDRGDQSGHNGHGDGVSEIDEVHGPGLVTPLSQLGLLDAFA